MNAFPATTKTLLKICGLTRKQDVEACLAQRITYVGFNFYEKSPRYLSPKAARLLWLEAKGEHALIPVAVVVDLQPFEEKLDAILKDFPEVQIIQFHGQETPDQLTACLKILNKRRIWKAIRVENANDVAQAEKFTSLVELVLFDGMRSGSGKTFDWHLLEAFSKKCKWGIAGGISPANVQDALQRSPDLIDVSSGVEDSPGKKNATKIAELVSLVS